MAVMEKIKVVAGLSFPYFPPRPTSGMPITAKTISKITDSYKNYHISPKLNGDRGILLYRDGAVHIANRHGSLYSFAVVNTWKFMQLANNTVIDGEIWKKNFYPFEAVVLGGVSLMKKCPTYRSAKANIICNFLDIPWRFGVPSTKWLKKMTLNGEEWEGVVKKRLGSPYTPLATATQSTSTWFKSKW